MKKKVIYKVTTKYSIEIEVENIDEEKLIEELNIESEKKICPICQKFFCSRQILIKSKYINWQGMNLI